MFVRFPQQYLALQNAVHALHQYKDMILQRIADRNQIKALQAQSRRHAEVNQHDSELNNAVEAGLLERVAELEQENARIRAELDRYTTLPNPLPRPPELIPLVTSLGREHPTPNVHASQHGLVQLGLGPAPVVSGAAPTIQSRSSSGGSRATAPSVHFDDPAPTRDRDSRSKYVVTADGEQLRQERIRRPHLVVPGAPPSQKVIPRRLTDGDSDATPRPPLTSVTAPRTIAPGQTYFPPHLQRYAPKDTSPCVWIGNTDVPHEILPTEVPLESLPQFQQGSSSRPLQGPSAGPSGPPPVIPPPPPGFAIPPTPARTNPEPLPQDLSRVKWDIRPAHTEGYVAANIPSAGGIVWIAESQAAQLRVRPRGYDRTYYYVIAKEPSQLEDRDRAPPQANPLQLSGVPQVPIAGPSSSVSQRGQYDPLPGASTAVSTLFRDPVSSGRTVASSASIPSASLSSINILAPALEGSRSSRSVGSTHSRGDDRLGRSTAGRVPAEPLGQPSPASSWGTVPTGSSTSLNDLNLRGFPSAPALPRPTESLELLPVGELNGGPVVITDMMTPRQGTSLFGDGAPVPVRTEPPPASGLLLNPSTGSSRVVSSLQDLQEVNRSLMQLTNSQDRDAASRHSSRPATRHSRHQSVSGDEGEGMVGPRTGLTLYASRPGTNYASRHASGDPSPPDPSPPTQSRPRSGASTGSHAESAHSSHSHHTSHSVHSSQSVHSSNSRRSGDYQYRPRRSSTASALDSYREREPEPAAWTTVPADLQPYGSSRSQYSSDSRSQKSHESIPRAMEGLGSGPASSGSLGLTFEAPSTSSAVTSTGEEAAIHAPRPVNGRRSGLFGSVPWNGRNGH